MQQENTAVRPRFTKRGKIVISSLCAAIVYLIWDNVAFAGGGDLSAITTQVQTQVSTVATLLVIVSYVAGVGFCLAGVVQFKAHKDNPMQVPLSKPIVYLSVGACLLFLPTIMKSAGETIFGGDQAVGDSSFSSADL